MPSGKRSRQLRAAAVAAPPPVRSKGGARARRQASPRVLMIAGGVAALVVVGVVLAVALSGGGKGLNVATLPTSGSLANALPGAADVNAVFKGIPQSGLTLGSPSAKVTLTEFIDLQCPYCQEFETQVMPSVVGRYVRTGKVKVVARPLAFIGPDSIRGRNAMLAAGAQGKAFNFAELLYDNQRTENTGWLDDGMIASAAESIPGLNPKQVFTARNSATVAAQAAQIDRAGAAAKVHQTPTLFVGTGGSLGNQVALKSPTDGATLTRALDAALAS
jgi:protein-disulfide isomerase